MDILNVSDTTVAHDAHSAKLAGDQDICLPLHRKLMKLADGKLSRIKKFTCHCLSKTSTVRGNIYSETGHCLDSDGNQPLSEELSENAVNVRVRGTRRVSGAGRMCAGLTALNIRPLEAYRTLDSLQLKLENN
ncbi:hypothetical protein J6590_049215 [Homalodisca vitripennis]|nr:hypothetical protein J6590_049215 [Homalodisca vitripennis]